MAQLLPASTYGAEEAPGTLPKFDFAATKTAALHFSV